MPPRGKVGPSNEAMAGAGAALVNIVSCYPIYKIMFRQQAYGYGVRQSIRSITQEGVSYLYRGVTAPLMQKTSSVALMFGMFHYTYGELWLRTGSNGTSQVYNLKGNNDGRTIWMSGLITGTLEALCFTPIERVQALLQAKEYNARFRGGFFRTFTEVNQIGGPKEYYRGFSAIVLRNGPQTALFFSLKPHVTTWLSQHVVAPTRNPIFVDFCSGAGIGAFGSTIFYPLGVAKSRMQWQLGGEFQSPLSILRTLNIRRLYSGVSTNLIRAVAGWGIINASYEVFLRALNGH